MSENKNSSYFVSGSILIGALIIAGAVIFTGNADNQKATALDQRSNGEFNIEDITIDPVSNNDRILGDPNAPVKIIEFSDLDCPFCARFHEVIFTIKPDYIDTGLVALVFRHFPLDSIHPDARRKAEASECIADLGGDDAFWSFIDTVFVEETTLNQIPSVVESLGIDSTDFSTCIDSGRFADKVQADVEDGLRAGAEGTPYSVVLFNEEPQDVISGALPASQIRSILDSILN